MQEKEITDEIRKKVVEYAELGLFFNQVAVVLGIDEQTLKCHCLKEYKSGFINAQTKLTQKLWEQVNKPEFQIIKIS